MRRLIHIEVIHSVDQVTKNPAVKPARRLWKVQSKTTFHDNESWNDVAMNCIRIHATPIPTKEPTALDIMPSRAPS